MERARELIKPYMTMDGVIGVYLVGSATRPFRDPLSDYDFEVIVEDDALALVPALQKLVFVIEEGPPRRVDHEFYLRPWTELDRLVRSTLDLGPPPLSLPVRQGLARPIWAPGRTRGTARGASGAGPNDSHEGPLS